MAGAAAALVESLEEQPMNLEAVIGFNGRVPSGLIYHPDGEHVIYPLGSTVVVKNLRKNTQAFLQGHTDRVTCVAISRDGKRIASGQRTSMGFRAPVMVWDFDSAVRNANTIDRTGELIHKLVLHKVMVRDVSFNCDGSFLASLGGEDDNTIVIWDLAAGEAVCGSPAASHAVMTLRWLNTDPLRLVSGGQYNLRKWHLDMERRRIFPAEFMLGTIRRSINCICLDPTDRFLWAGTASGDVIEMNVASERFARASKNRFSKGVTALAFVDGPPGDQDHIVCGNGDGTLVRLSTAHLEITSAVQLLGGVSSISAGSDGHSLFAGTRDGNRYFVDVDAFEPKLRATAHPDPVTCVAYPLRSSALFVTGSTGEVRLWNAVERKELLRIQVPGVVCQCVQIKPDGSLIVSGWQDGRVRAFLPESGRLAYVINDAHVDGVTALSFTHDGSTLVTGGADGRVRVWDVSGSVQVMLVSWKEHKRAVTDVAVSADNDEAVTSSADGSCIVWNLRRSVRQSAIFASTVFRGVRYHPDESQLLTCGSDRKLGYWDTTDGTAIRQLDASSAELLCVDVARDGLSLATAGADKTVRVWLYDEGVPLASGVGHSESVTAVRVSPDGHHVASVGLDGAIMLWTYPELPEGVGQYDDDEEEAGAAAAAAASSEA
ncbi:hypothetical protein FNF29_06724 [Cafeteria roenbergensis]|uniref:Cilia- and flagella-associated protein 52 n=1 Tax=Cafeteria roenbergensis TaxID=33653 RepID=A0A5A8C6N0_CAFRO|nr:hypothetical protein FNF29_06724 [Cafeteria roenbergensis]|eukprot:KAA0148337.1 hypothetical protein FNF29_06724 [Cafeteria roenbergensis]